MILKETPELEKELIHKFNLIFWGCTTVLFVIFLAVFLFCVIVLENALFSLVYSPFLILAIVHLAPYAKDVRSVKAKRFEKIAGEVIGYKEDKSVSPARRTYYYPIVKDNDSNQQIVLDVNIGQYHPEMLHSPSMLGIGAKYTFLYLKNSKLAVYKKESKSYGEEDPE